MRAEWLQRGASDRLILVLSGWAVGPAPFRHLRGAADVLVLWDWRDLSPPGWPGGYGRIDLLAYSFGVGAACRMALPADAGLRVAACGSGWPCDDRLGIPRATLRATEAGLDAEALRRFARRAGVPALPGADLPALRAELRAVMGWAGVPAVPRFDRILLGARDRIFPPENLNRAWQAQAARLRILPSGHNPFALMRDWDEVLA